MKNATEPKGLSRRVLALVTALLLTLVAFARLLRRLRRGNGQRHVLR